MQVAPVVARVATALRLVVLWVAAPAQEQIARSHLPYLRPQAPAALPLVAWAQMAQVRLRMVLAAAEEVDRHAAPLMRFRDGGVDYRPHLVPVVAGAVVSSRAVAKAAQASTGPSATMHWLARTDSMVCMVAVVAVARVAVVAAVVTVARPVLQMVVLAARVVRVTA